MALFTYKLDTNQSADRSHPDANFTLTINKFVPIKNDPDNDGHMIVTTTDN